MQLILVTHPRTGDLRESLKYIYKLYVDYVVKNPLYTPGSPIRSATDFHLLLNLLYGYQLDELPKCLLICAAVLIHVIAASNLSSVLV